MWVQKPLKACNSPAASTTATCWFCTMRILASFSGKSATLPTFTEAALLGGAHEDLAAFELDLKLTQGLVGGPYESFARCDVEHGTVKSTVEPDAIESSLG